jgi:hypothetical protein
MLYSLPSIRTRKSLDGVRDTPNQPLEDEPQRVKDDLHALSPTVVSRSPH